MTHGIDPAPQSVQESGFDPSADAVLGETQVQELSYGDHSVLTPGQRADGVIQRVWPPVVVIFATFRGHTSIIPRRL